MGHNDESTYSGRVYSIVALSNTADVVIAATTHGRIAWGLIVGGAAAHTIAFRRTSAGVNYFSVRVPANGVIPLGGFRTKADANGLIGLEVISGDAAGDVTVVLGLEDLAH